MIEKNDFAEVVITDQIQTGEGVGKADGFPLFIKNAVIGDVIRTRVTKVNKNYGYGRLEEILRPSDFRIEAPCDAFPKCGGCQIMSMSYEGQLAFKQKKVEDCIRRIGGFDNLTVEKIIGADSPLRYRNKAQYPVGIGNDGKTAAGFYAGRSHRIIRKEDCLLSPELFGRILQTVLSWMAENRISAYDEEKKKGVVRHVFIRSGEKTGQVCVCVIINSKKLPFGNKLVDMLAAYPEVVSISYSVNLTMSNVIMSDTAVCIYGKPFIEDKIGDISYRISPNSFFQVNPAQTEKLYAKAVEFAGLTGRETVWDVYCGIGTISLQMARKAKMVYGVEIIERAVADARENAKLNGIGNASFYAGKAEEVLPRLYSKENIKGDVIVIDPPRKGCEVSVLETIAEMRPERVVYVSCDPATLARDMKVLAEKGYMPEKVQPVDMFPNTVHVETVCLLSKLSNTKHHVEVELNLDEMDLTSAESKATYDEIREYVMAQTGLHVTNLNIAQIKRKCGIIERENYNLPKSEDSKQPNCTKEKEEAIKAAFRHFGMI